MDWITFKLQAITAINSATNETQLEEFRIQYLGKNGLVNQFMKKIKDIPSEQKGRFGQAANQAKKDISQALEDKLKEYREQPDAQTKFDVTMPGKKPKMGHLHLVSQAIEDISQIFTNIGFIRARYPEVDWDYFAFEALNMPASHPARDEWETLFVDTPINDKYGKMVLTPHTSNGQVREMLRLNSKPPIRMINIGKCYRRQQDISHALMFHQFEGLVVDKDINITHLKGTLNYFAKTFYGKDRKIRLRPYHFQFTEPSFEIDVSCAVCHGTGKINGKNCRTCKQGWLELGGAGMVHPNVLKAGGIDSKKYSGFAFGWGVERVYMMRSDVKIDDIRYLYNNDVRFLEQF